MCGPRKLLCVLGVVLAALAAPVPAQPEEAGEDREARPVERTLLERVRDAYLAGPTTERLRVSVRRGEGIPRRSLLLVTLEPREDGSGLERAVVRAGRLLIEARAGRVRGMLDAPEGAMFEARPSAGTVHGSLEAALPPLPAAQLWLAEAASVPPRELTSYARNVRWDVPDLVQRAGTAQLSGTCDGGRISVQVDAATARVRRLMIVLDPARPGAAVVTITVEHAPSTAELRGVRFEPGGRVMVGSLSALVSEADWPAVGTPLRLGAAAEGSPSVQSLLKPAPERARPALVLLLGEDALDDPSGRAGAAAALMTGVAEVLRADRQAEETPLDAALLAATGIGEDEALERVRALVSRGAGPVACGAYANTWAELARVARVAGGSRGAFVCVGGDGTILSVHPLEEAPNDPEQHLAELVMALLDAAHAPPPSPPP